MLYVAIGIIGATVMPHNLYLHSALVHSRHIGPGEEATRRAIRFNTFDTVAALSVAFLVNAAILVLAAEVFYSQGKVILPEGEVAHRVVTPDGEVGYQTEGADKVEEDIDWIRVGYRTLTPLLNTTLASVLFAIALLASGQSSTITGTLAGQVVMEGFLHWRVRPWVRRLITRSLAVLPAIFIIGWRGDSSVTNLLVLSQVVLAMQLPLAMFPLLHFTSTRKWMGQFANGWFLLIAGWGSALFITALDLYGLPEAVEKAWEFVVHG